MQREQLAELIDAYADARVSGNKYLCREMISKLEDSLTSIFNELNGLRDQLDKDVPGELD